MNDARQKMSNEEFRLLKQRLYQALHALELSLRDCPDLQMTFLKLSDGHELTADEILSWLKAVRSDCWKYGPDEVQLRHIKGLLAGQPKG